MRSPSALSAAAAVGAVTSSALRCARTSAPSCCAWFLLGSMARISDMGYFVVRFMTTSSTAAIAAKVMSGP